MKTVLRILTIIFISLSSSCVNVHLPSHGKYNKKNIVKTKKAPGHQKKIYGDKSAKKYAPGRRKKNKK